MRRAYSVRQAGQWDNAAAIDRVVLDANERHRRRMVLTAERGTDRIQDRTTEPASIPTPKVAATAP